MNQRILLADDSLTIQKVVELTFMDESFDVEAVGSGDEAIASLEREVPSILIADVHMPGSSGYEVCRRAKQLDPTLPVLLLVGTFEALDEDEIVACGADGNLKKPFDSQELLQIVKTMAIRDSRAAWAAARVEGLETTRHEPTDPEPEPSGVTGFETTVFDLQPSPGDEPEFVPSAGFDFGSSTAAGSIDDQMAERVPVGSAEPPAGAFDTVAGPMDDLLGALDDVEPRSPAVDDSWTDEGSAEPATSGADHAAADSVAGVLSEADVERVARRLVEMLGEQTVREVAWEVIPDLAEVVIKERIRELEAEAE